MYTREYRYGFNGKEKDDEVYNGDGDCYDYGMRMYNSRLGRFLSVDPLTGNFPWYTPYQFARNKPIWAIDLDGMEEYTSNEGVGTTPPSNPCEGSSCTEESGNTEVFKSGEWKPLATQSLPEVNVEGYQDKPAYSGNSSNSVAHSFVEGIANSVYPGMYNKAGNMNESQKQNYFDSDANASIAIILREFATGAGPSHRDFGTNSALSKDLGRNSLIQDAVMKFQQDPSKSSFNVQFERKNVLSAHLDALPDALLMDNWTKMFVGSFTAKIQRIDANYVEVTAVNTTSIGSLMYHAANNVPAGFQFSNKDQTFHIEVYAPQKH